MAIPSIFTQRGSKAVASYDFYDLAARVGYKRFYGANTEDGTYLLFGSTIPSDDTRSAGVSGANTEYNFDVTFNSQQILKGKAFISILAGMDSASDNASTLALQLKLYHVTSTGTETQLGATKTTDAFNSIAASLIQVRSLAFMEIPNTIFKAGETLRLEVVMTFNKSGANCNAYIYHDCSDRITFYSLEGNVGADLIVDVPFKIDI